MLFIPYRESMDILTLNNAAPQVLVTDVTLREFGQNVPLNQLESFSPETRVRIARQLLEAGVPALEVFSCVHPRVAPAMSPDILSHIASVLEVAGEAELVTLVPNLAGYRTFLGLGLGPDGHDHVLGMFVSAVEIHNMANLGRSISDSLEEYETLARDAMSRGIRLNGYVSGAFGFREPSGGLIPAGVKTVGYMMDRFFQMGARMVTLSDLQGVADENATVEFFHRLLDLRKGKDLASMAYHPHNISGEEAVNNSIAVLALGIRRFDASLGGTGGCVTGAPGNQPTELLVRRLHEAGAFTGINEELLGEIKSSEGL